MGSQSLFRTSGDFRCKAFEKVRRTAEERDLEAALCKSVGNFKTDVARAHNNSAARTLLVKQSAKSNCVGESGAVEDPSQICAGELRSRSAARRDDELVVGQGNSLRFLAQGVNQPAARLDFDRFVMEQDLDAAFFLEIGSIVDNQVVCGGNFAGNVERQTAGSIGDVSAFSRTVISRSERTRRARVAALMPAATPPIMRRRSGGMGRGEF